MSRRARRAAATTAALVVVATAGAHADEWHIPGARYQAMGGAGVAVVNDAHASYWNPAALAFNQGQDFEIPFSFTLDTEGGGIAAADEIANFIDGNALLATLTKIDTGTPLTALELQDALQLGEKLLDLGEDGEGAVALPDVDFLYRKGRMALSLRGSGTLGVDPVLDFGNLSFSNDFDVTDVVGGGADRSALFTNPGSQALADAIALAFGAWGQNQAEELVYQAEQGSLNTSAPDIRALLTQIAGDTAGGLSATLANNLSGAFLNGIFTQEVGLGYAQPLMGNRLSIGGNVRMIRGVTTSKFIRYDAVKNGEDLIRELSDFESEETSQNATLDLGVMYRPDYRWRIGVVARNLTSPEFDTAAGDDYEMKPQVRAGVALNLVPGLLLAADVDVTENDSETIDGLASRMLSVGSEFQLAGGDSSVALRAGAFTNLAAEDPARSVTLTAGLGFRILGLQLDLAVSAAPDLEDLEEDGLTLPSRLNVSGALKWAGQF